MIQETIKPYGGGYELNFFWAETDTETNYVQIYQIENDKLYLIKNLGYKRGIASASEKQAYKDSIVPSNSNIYLKYNFSPTGNTSVFFDKIHINQADSTTKVTGRSILSNIGLSGEFDYKISATRFIRDLFRRCLCKKEANGQVAITFLNNENSSYYEDGTLVGNLMLNGVDSMVYFPKFYYYCSTPNDSDDLIYHLSLTKVDSSWKEFSECLVGVYEGTVYNSKLFSSPDFIPSVSLSQKQMKEYARQHGSGYQLIDYDQTKMIVWLFYAIYGDRNCHSVCGSGKGSGGYTGGTLTLGNRDTTTANGNTIPVNFLGMENCYGGNISEWLDNVIRSPSSGSRLTEITDTVTGAVRTVSGMLPNNSWEGIKKVVGGEFLDICASSWGDYRNYYCGYQFLSSSNMVMARSGYGKGSCETGVMYTYCGGNTNSTFSNVGSRLAFRGKIRMCTPTEFKSLPIL